jgi:hypothetical protein
MPLRLPKPALSTLAASIGTALLAVSITHHVLLPAQHSQIISAYARELAMLLKVIARSSHLLMVAGSAVCFASAFAFIGKRMPVQSLNPAAKGLVLFALSLTTQDVARFICVNALGVNPFT